MMHVVIKSCIKNCVVLFTVITFVNEVVYYPCFFRDNILVDDNDCTVPSITFSPSLSLPIVTATTTTTTTTEKSKTTKTNSINKLPTEEKDNKNNTDLLRPNFVILLLDDHGYGDVGIYGNTKDAVKTTETPHMDALGKSGIQFTDFHAGASVCTPSRAALMTGRYGLRTGVTKNFQPMSLGGLPPEEITIAELLPSFSMERLPCYRKHMIGKWHLGHKQSYHPSYRGFDTFYGLPYSADLGCLDMTPQSCKPHADRSHSTPACPALCNNLNNNNSNDTSSNSNNHIVGIPLYDTHNVNCNDKPCDETITEQPVNEFTLNHRYAKRAEDVIAQEANSPNQNPFFLYVGFAHTHTPMAYDPHKWSNSSNRPGWKRHYGNTLAEVDDAVGRIIHSLHKHDIAENTLVILTSDNGPADVKTVDCDFIGSPGPFLGKWQTSIDGGGGGATMKDTIWEGGHRVVGIISWPGTIEAGRISKDIISTLDIFPTISTLAGISLPSDRSYDGIDISPLLINKSMTMSQLLKQRKTSNQTKKKREQQTKKQQHGKRKDDEDGSDVDHDCHGDDDNDCFDDDDRSIAEAIDITGDGLSYERILFHPNTHYHHRTEPTISGQFDAVRVGKYKFVFESGGGKAGCYSDNVGHTAHHMPPLIFDLDNDPGESKPIPISSLPSPTLIDKVIAARKAKMKNIHSTLSHQANYDIGINKFESSPCCNHKSNVCRCPWQEEAEEEAVEQEEAVKQEQ